MSDSHASTTDVETILLRKMSAEELDLANKLLALASARLRLHYERSVRRGRPDVLTLDQRIRADDDFASIVNYVEASAVARIVRNPDGLTYEVIGPYATQRPAAGTTGFEFTDAELAQIGISSKAFSIAPYFAPPVLIGPEGLPSWYVDFPTGGAL